MQNSPEPLESVTPEIRRYIVMPGQATSYKIGMLKIQQLRNKAETALGDQFDIRGFHDAVLGGGAMPLPILERVVDQWIDSNKNQRGKLTLRDKGATDENIAQHYSGS